MAAETVEGRIEKLEKSLKDMRRRVDEADRGHRGEIVGLRYAVFASVASGVLLALTATTWRFYEGEDPDIEDVTTLWGMVPEGWLGTVTLALVLVLALGTVGVFLADTAGRTTHVVFAVLALLTVVAILFVGLVEPDAWYDAEDAESAPGRWLALLTALSLAVTHAARGGELRR
jgi:hypothetical protein